MSNNSPSNLPSEEQATVAPSQSQPSQQTGISVSAEFSGPLPHPAILRGYESVLTGAAERILTAFEEEQKHRQRLEQQHLNINIEIAKRNLQEQLVGQILAFIISLVLIAASTYLAIQGHDWIAGVLGGTTLIGALGLFLHRRSKTLNTDENN